MAKTKRIESNAYVYTISTDRHNYVVTLEGMKNDINGNRRYKATIAKLEPQAAAVVALPFVAVYTFTSRGEGTKKDAEFIVNRYEKGE